MSVLLDAAAILSVCHHVHPIEGVSALPRCMGKKGWGHNQQDTTMVLNRSHVAPSCGGHVLSIVDNLEAVSDNHRASFVRLSIVSKYSRS